MVQEDKPSCILFLSGWGMDPAPFRSTKVNKHDLLMVYDYSWVEPEAIIKKLNKYDSLHLVAWSMGVWVAGKYFSSYKDRFSSAIAINGTLKPMDDTCGIPVKAFNEMVSGFSSAVLEQFYKDMFDQVDQSQSFLDSRPERSQKSIATELQTLQQNYGVLGAGDDIFTKKIVGSRDRIFPARSQLRSWGKKSCECIKAGHFPFYNWSNFDLIINGDTKNSCG